jgi:hypothetical protein
MQVSEAPTDRSLITANPTGATSSTIREIVSVITANEAKHMLPPNHPIPHRPGCFSFGRPNLRMEASTILVSAAVGLFASARTFAEAAESSPRIAQQHHACAVVMGLPQPGELYDTGIRSLDRSLSERDQARLLSTDRSGCAWKGLQPGTPAFALCVINAEQSQ